MKILMLPDTQSKRDVPNYHLRWVGESIIEEKPDVIICIGDHFDMESLSSYDYGKRAAEGRRFSDDIRAGHAAMCVLLEPLLTLQAQQKKNKKKVYAPRMEFLLGNHEQRVERHIEANPQLDGIIQYPEVFGLERYGWDVHPFLEVIEVGGISFAHYFYNQLSGRPLGGTAHTKLKNIGTSFVQGHVQGIDMAMRSTNAGQMQLGVVAGSCYLHDEAYKGPQGNTHWRGILYLDNVNNGFADVRPVSLDSLRIKYDV